MRILMVISLIAVGLGLALVVREPAYARTRTPTPTATPTTTATPPSVVAEFMGTAWVYGRLATNRIEARIGTVVCGETAPLGGDTPTYDLKVLPAEEKAGCGRPGAVIAFFVDGREANQTATWDSAVGTFKHLTLIVGAPFAQFWGEAALAQMTVEKRIMPYVGNIACGYQLSSWQGPMSPYPYQVVVYSDALQAGCGTEGAEVTFKLLDGEGNVIAVAPEIGVWHAWDGDSQIPRLDLIFGPAGGITIGSVGTGGSQGSGTALWGELSLVLAAVGLGGVAAGVALRKRVSGRRSA